MKTVVMNILIFLVLLPVLVAQNDQIDRLSKNWEIQSLLFHYLPTMSPAQTNSYYGYDFVVVDPETPFSSPASVDKLRTNNPNIRILCYINPPEWFVPMFPDKPWSIKVVDFLNKVPEWWLRGTDGKILSFWTGMYTANCAIDAPKIQFQGEKVNYIEFLSKIYIENILKNYQFDGVVIDNLWEKIHWIGQYGQNRAGVDRNQDGVTDDPKDLNHAWKAGLEYFTKEIRKFGGPDFLIIGNPANLSFLDKANGKNFENFPDVFVNEKDTVYQAWYDNLQVANSMQVAVFNARSNNQWFTLCSAHLLDNTIFAHAQNTAYNQAWKLNLGKPLNKAENKGLEVVRKFENGTIFVNPRNQTARIEYNDGSTRMGL